MWLERGREDSIAILTDTVPPPPPTEKPKLDLIKPLPISSQQIFSSTSSSMEPLSVYSERLGQNTHQLSHKLMQASPLTYLKSYAFAVLCQYGLSMRVVYTFCSQAIDKTSRLLQQTMKRNLNVYLSITSLRLQYVFKDTLFATLIRYRETQAQYPKTN